MPAGLFRSSGRRGTPSTLDGRFMAGRPTSRGVGPGWVSGGWWDGWGPSTKLLTLFFFSGNNYPTITTIATV